MASNITENATSGTYRSQQSPRGASLSSQRPQTVQPKGRDITLMDVRRLGASVDNLITDLSDLFSTPVDVPGTKSDVINEFGIMSNDGTDSKQRRDSIQLFFDDITNKKRIQFRATISNITEAHSPEWVQHNYIGRPYPIHQYKGVSRSLTFDLKVYAMNKKEVEHIWQKLNWLTGLTHPASYVGGASNGVGFMTPPYMELTIGKVFRTVPGFLNSLTYTIPDGISWDINKELPLGIDINVGYNIIERKSESNAIESQFYKSDGSGNFGSNAGSIFSGWGDAWKDFRGSE